jgi:hypothetical protein
MKIDNDYVERIGSFHEDVLSSFRTYPAYPLRTKELSKRLCKLIAETPEGWDMESAKKCREGDPTMVDLIDLLKADIQRHKHDDRILQPLHSLLRTALMIRSCDLVGTN